MKLTIPQATRPKMRNYGIHDTSEGLLDWSWVSKQLNQAQNYWICSTRPDGRPHAAPVWGVVLDDIICFGTDKNAVKTSNLQANAQVVVHLESGDDCVIIEGVVVEINDLETLEKMAAAYPSKYPTFKPTAKELQANINYAVQPNLVMAWKESDFPKTATRWVFSLD
jgi:pyridoxamine 5'-phosphate oxidase-like protein